jgi:flagellar biosynthesis protein FlhF
MKTKKFVAPTIREALQQVKAELGDGAIILKSEKVLRGGVFDLMKREIFEVTAAPEEEASITNISGPDFAQQLDSSLAREKDGKGERETRFNLEILKDEVRGLKEGLAEISTQLKYSKMPALPHELAEAYTRLDESGLEEHWAQDLMAKALVELAADQLVSSPDIDRFLMAQLSGVFAGPTALRADPRKSLCMAFVGPAGSGKTTTLLKLATHKQFFGRRQVGIITADTRRLAAIEQIRAFARLAAIPLEVVYNLEQMGAARRRLQQSEVVLVDTSGCSPRDEEGLARLHDIVEKADCDEVHLVLSATTRDRDLCFACDKYRAVAYSHLLFTHADETTQYGTMANVARYAGKSISFIGYGSTIPEDIQKMEPQQITDWILHPDKGIALRRVGLH